MGQRERLENVTAASGSLLFIIIYSAVTFQQSYGRRLKNLSFAALNGLMTAVSIFLLSFPYRLADRCLIPFFLLYSHHFWGLFFSSFYLAKNEWE